MDRSAKTPSQRRHVSTVSSKHQAENRFVLQRGEILKTHISYFVALADKVHRQMQNATNPLVSFLPARVLLLHKVPQIVVIVEIEERHKLL